MPEILFPVDPNTELDEVVWWRAEQLVKVGGFDPEQAMILAMMRPAVDLHKACELGKAAGPDKAFEILF